MVGHPIYAFLLPAAKGWDFTAVSSIATHTSIRNEPVTSLTPALPGASWELAIMPLELTGQEMLTFLLTRSLICCTDHNIKLWLYS